MTNLEFFSLLQRVAQEVNRLPDSHGGRRTVSVRQKIDFGYVESEKGRPAPPHTVLSSPLLSVPLGLHCPYCGAPLPNFVGDN